MESIFKANGIKEVIMDDLIELNGNHEVTDREIGFVTQPEWKTILSKHYPDMDLTNKNISVDLENEIITLE